MGLSVIDVAAIAQAELLGDMQCGGQGLDGNIKFQNPPVPISALKTEVATLSSKITNAEDGSEQAIKERGKQAAVVMKMMEQLAHYVEAASDNDSATFGSSGFVLKSTTKASPTQLAQPAPPTVDQGNTGQALVSPKKDKKALTYQIRWGVWSGCNVASWTIVTTSSTRPPTPINGLTLGTVYAFQVSAFGSAGHSDWSDIVTRMVI